MQHRCKVERDICASKGRSERIAKKLHCVFVLRTLVKKKSRKLAHYRNVPRRSTKSKA